MNQSVRTSPDHQETQQEEKNEFTVIKSRIAISPLGTHTTKTTSKAKKDNLVDTKTDTNTQNPHIRKHFIIRRK